MTTGQPFVIPAEFVTCVEFSRFWEHYLGQRLFAAFTEESLGEVRDALLHAGVPPMTVVAYFIHLGGMVEGPFGSEVVGRIERIQNELFTIAA